MKVPGDRIQSVQDGRDLAQAVYDFLDEMHESDESGERVAWPVDLAELVGWTAPEEDEQ